METSRTIALVGATGHLGQMIAEDLLAMPDARLRMLVRPESRGKGADLEARGATVVEGTLDDDDALAALCDGTFTVISAVQGGPDVIIDGQRRLLRAAREAGARRFIPSDFSFDLFNLREGANLNSDWRRAFAEAAEGERGAVEVVHVLNGCFLDRGVLFGFLGAFDLGRNEAYLWGDGEAPMDFTTYRDTARYTAAAAMEKAALPRMFCVAGDVLDFHGLVSAFEEASGRRIDVRYQGSLDALDARIADLQRTDPDNLYAYLPLMYWRAMLNGRAKLQPLHNDRYPSIRPTTVREYVAAEDL